MACPASEHGDESYALIGYGLLPALLFIRLIPWLLESEFMPIEHGLSIPNATLLKPQASRPAKAGVPELPRLFARYQPGEMSKRSI